MTESQVFDVKGTWWARRPDGVWVKWDSIANGWLPYPKPPTEIAVALAKGQIATSVPPKPPPTEPLNVVDEWYNRNFPAHSVGRLLFLMVANIPISLAVGMQFGRIAGIEIGPRWLLTLLVMVVSEIVIFSAWTTARRQEGGLNTPKRPPAPPARIEGQPARPEPPISPDDIRRAPLVALGFAMFLFITELLQGFEDVASSANLSVLAAMSLLLTAVWVLRRTIVAPLMLSAIFGFGAALVIHIFTIFLGGSSFLPLWAVCTAMAATVVVPAWLGYRRRPRTRLTPPSWAVIVCTCLMVWGSAYMSRA